MSRCLPGVYGESLVLQRNVGKYTKSKDCMSRNYLCATTNTVHSWRQEMRILVIFRVGICSTCSVYGDVFDHQMMTSVRPHEDDLQRCNALWTRCRDVCDVHSTRWIYQRALAWYANNKCVWCCYQPWSRTMCVHLGKSHPNYAKPLLSHCDTADTRMSGVYDMEIPRYAYEILASRPAKLCTTTA